MQKRRAALDDFRNRHDLSPPEHRAPSTAQRVHFHGSIINFLIRMTWVRLEGWTFPFTVENRVCKCESSMLSLKFRPHQPITRRLESTWNGKRDERSACLCYWPSKTALNNNQHSRRVTSLERAELSKPQEAPLDAQTSSNRDAPQKESPINQSSHLASTFTLSKPSDDGVQLIQFRLFCGGDVACVVNLENFDGSHFDSDFVVASIKINSSLPRVH